MCFIPLSAFSRINLLADHVKDGSPSKTQINLQLLKLILLLRDNCGMLYDFPQSEIRRMIGILKTNGMSLEPRHDGEQVLSFPLKKQNQDNVTYWRRVKKHII